MSDFCDDPSGPFRLTVRGARETVVETRGEIYAILDAMTPADRNDTKIQALDPGWNVEDGGYVYDVLRLECGEVQQQQRERGRLASQDETGEGEQSDG